jgi:hypothetical protein
MILKWLARLSCLTLAVDTDVQAISRNYALVVFLVVMQAETTFVLAEHGHFNSAPRHCTTLSHVTVSVQVVRLLL